MMHRKFILALMFVGIVTVLFCGNNSDMVGSGNSLASVSGRVLYPDSLRYIYLISNKGIDSATCDPATRMFVFDSLEFGNYILQVRARDYALYEQKLVLNRKEFRFHDITLTKNPIQVNSFYPPNSLHIDSVYCSLSSESLSDSGFTVSVNFLQGMDTASVEAALTIIPHTADMKVSWYFDGTVAVFVPRKKLSEIDTLRVSIDKAALDRLGEPMEYDFSVFYSIDTAFFRSELLQ